MNNVIQLKPRWLLEQELKIAGIKLDDAYNELLRSEIECSDIQHLVDQALDLIVERVKTWEDLD